MEHTKDIIGYRVVSINGFFVDTTASGVNFTTDEKPTPVARGDALRRMAAFLDANPGEPLEDYEVRPVYRELTPLETTSKELGGLLSSLCRRHGLDLGLTTDDIEQRIALELGSIGATGIGIIAAAARAAR